MIRVSLATVLLLGGILLARVGEAGQRGAAPGTPTAAAEPAALDPPFAFDGPPAPVAPATVTRDAAGRATIRAVRLGSPIRLDGQLDEAVYQEVPPISDFIQTEPSDGEPATQKTEVWVLFDRSHIYVTVRLWESHPERMIVNEMRRDNTALYRNDHIDIVFDTFYDRRNGVLLSTTPIGGLVDAQITNERQFHTDWNPVWEVETGRFDGGWTAEFAIPFKSLRYRPGRAQIWGFNVQRENLWKNEISTLIPAPAALGSRGVMQFSLAPTLVGLEAPPGSKNLDIKPYLASNVTTDRTATPAVSERGRRRCRARREVRDHAEPDRRFHLQHRFRPGRSRRAAGEPHALQPVLSGEARVLPREPGDVRLRRRLRPAAPPATRRFSSTAGASA